MEAVKGAERGVHPSDKLASFAPHQLTLAKCRFGSKADIPPCGTMSALPPIADIRADEIDVRFVPLPNKVRCSNLQRFIEDLVGQAKLLSKGEARRIAANIAEGGLIFALAGLLLLLRGSRDIRPL